MDDGHDQAAGSESPAVRPTRPTMRDVAAHVGVSQSLVSLVFRNAPGASNATRQRVLRAAEEIDYHPDMAASVLRRHRSRHLGVLFSMGHPFGVDLVDNIYLAAERLGYDVVLSALTPTRGEARAVQDLLGYRSEALILLGAGTDTQLLAQLARRVPLVTVGHRSRHPAMDAVRTDDARGVREAVNYLFSLGHRDIVHVDGGAGPGAAERRRGYRQAMRRHELNRQIRVLPGDYTEEAGARAAQALLDDQRLPTAIVAGNDESALGLLDHFIRAGVKIPGDLSVVGYDDSRVARLPFLNLTTVHQDPARMAQLAVQAAQERLDQGRTTARDIVLQPTLVVRGTTGPARSNQPRSRASKPPRVSPPDAAARSH